MNRKSPQKSIEVICEDRNHRAFIESYLNIVGFVNRRNARINYSVAPAGEGAAEQWVREKCADMIVQIERKLKSKEITLLVMIDADNKNVNDVVIQLQTAIRKKVAHFEINAVRMGILVPSRNIESWFFFLDHDDVDEKTNYKMSYHKKRVRFDDVAKKMRQWCSEQKEMPSSMFAAKQQWQRLKLGC